MKALALILALTLPSVAFAGPWRIQAPPSWTAEPDDAEPEVSIDSWFTEGGTSIANGVFVGPLLPGEIRPLVGGVFLGTGRTVCANATAERTGQPDTRVQAVPACATFPLYKLVPPVLLAPTAAP